MTDTEVDYTAYLNAPMNKMTNDAAAESVSEYFLALAAAVWLENEGFSGKRPFGNSGWDSEVYNALCDAGLMEGTKKYQDEALWTTTYEEEARVNKILLEALRRAKIVVE